MRIGGTLVVDATNRLHIWPTLIPVGQIVHQGNDKLWKDNPAPVIVTDPRLLTEIQLALDSIDRRDLWRGWPIHVSDTCWASIQKLTTSKDVCCSMA